MEQQVAQPLDLQPNENIRPLEEVLQYQNENVPHRFLKHFDVTPEFAEEIFHETKKWLWMCSVAYELKRLEKIDFIIGIIRGLPLIDQMWHNFILHTEAYEEFCEKYFGAYVHHVPTTKKADEYKQQFSDQHVSEMKTFYKNQYSLTYDLLGEETCVKWYKEWAEKYTRAAIDDIRKPLAKQPG
jgi:hypothetical protein